MLLSLLAIRGTTVDAGPIKLTKRAVLTKDIELLPENIFSTMRKLREYYTAKKIKYSDFDGIYIEPGCKDIEIRNGTIVSDQEGTNKGFRYGVYAPVYASDHSRTIRVVDLRVSGCRYGGIYLDCSNVLVKSCVVNDNGTSYSGIVYGIFAGTGSQPTV